MDVILLEKIGKSGQIGSTVKVKDGYARNWLLPQGKALRATKENQSFFEKERTQIEARNADSASKAEALAGRLEDTDLVILRQAGETGQLYGSVSARDIAEALAKAVDLSGVALTRDKVRITHAIKTIGVHEAVLALHAGVNVSVKINVARSEDEAAEQAQEETEEATPDQTPDLEEAKPDETGEADEAGDGEQADAAPDDDSSADDGEQADAAPESDSSAGDGEQADAAPESDSSADESEKTDSA